MCGSVLSVCMHMHLVMLAIVPKCFCLFVQRSIECLLGTDEDAKVPEGTMGKEHGRGSPTSPDLIGFREKCSHEFVENKLRWVYKKSGSSLSWFNPHSLQYLSCVFVQR